MARLVKVFVHDRTGRGIPGERVEMYGGPKLRTDKEGIAEMLVTESKVAITVNGSMVYDGYVSGLPTSGVLTYEKG
jgi:hypothetical protein